MKTVLLVWLVFLVAVPAFAYTQVDRVDADPGGDRPDDQPGTTYLVVGSDSREGLTKEERQRFGTGNAAGRRTDTIMLLHTGRGPSTLISIPRDSLVPIPEHGTTKINAAYAYGGPKLLVQTIEENTGVRIDDYVEIGFGGLVNVVDAVGGIRLCTKRRLDDPLANLKMSKGCHDADGVMALGYARTRHTQANGDVDRGANQRKVIGKIGDKVKSPWSVINPVRYARLNLAAAGSVKVSEGTGPLAMAGFVWGMSRAGSDAGKTCGMPIADLQVNWDSDRALALLALIKEDKTDEIGKSLCTPTGLPPGVA